MAFFFPANYHASLSLKDTIKYMSWYYDLLTDDLVKQFNLKKIAAPLVTTYLNTTDAYINANRVIDFDNKNSDQVFQIYNNLANWLRIKIKQTQTPINSGLYCDFLQINRDAFLNNLSSVSEQHLLIEYNCIYEEQSLDGLKKYFGLVTDMIEKNNKHQLFEKYEVPSLFKQRLNYILASDLEKLYPTLPITTAIEHYVAQKGTTVILQTNKKLLSGRVINHGYPTADDYSLTGELYCNLPILNTPISLVKIAFRPSYEQAYDQLLADMPNAFISGIYTKAKLSELNLQTLSIDLNFSNLMFYNCKKVHLCEVVSSPWDDDLILYCLKNKIEIM